VNAIHLSNFYGALARAVRGPADIKKLQEDKKFKQLLTSTIDKLKIKPEWFEIRQIAIITHSMAKMQISDARFYGELLNLRERIAKEGKPQVSGEDEQRLREGYIY